jgi:hypothetical protein
MTNGIDRHGKGHRKAKVVRPKAKKPAVGSKAATLVKSVARPASRG